MVHTFSLTGWPPEACRVELVQESRMRLFDIRRSVLSRVANLNLLLDSLSL